MLTTSLLACEDKTELERPAQAWRDRLALFGLKLNVKKAKYLTTDVNEHGSVEINGTELSRVTSFKYLGSTVTSDGILKLEVNARVCEAQKLAQFFDQFETVNYEHQIAASIQRLTSMAPSCKREATLDPQLSTVFLKMPNHHTAMFDLHRQEKCQCDVLHLLDRLTKSTSLFKELGLKGDRPGQG
ncbi:unnamed protein product [Heligmosomoides polygyrus]|uniref:Retrovirus-related Pol polyprotein from transposon TNT 1-94 n=1 Tax=Heligmosomoides polygyrus TaxID=6339 RepID=A0A183F4B9_HELPZ|nr:unnamed protein product [Heligmosomoides polygyrus]